MDSLSVDARADVRDKAVFGILARQKLALAVQVGLLLWRGDPAVDNLLVSSVALVAVVPNEVPPVPTGKDLGNDFAVRLPAPEGGGADMKYFAGSLATDIHVICSLYMKS